MANTTNTNNPKAAGSSDTSDIGSMATGAGEAFVDQAGSADTAESSNQTESGMRGIGSRLSGMSSSQISDTLSTAFTGVRDQLGRLSQNMNIQSWPAASRDLMSKVDTQARANPWISVGLVGAGALLLGYAIGRGSSRSMTEIKGIATQMGRGYDDFDDAIDE